MNKSIYTLFSLVFMTTAMFAGCDLVESDKGQEPEVKIQMKTLNSSDVMNKRSAMVLEEDQLVITEVKMFIEEMELDGTSGTKDFEVENFIINLPLDGSPLILTRGELPPGLYDEFEMEIEKPDDDVDVSDPEFRDETGSYSMVIKGSYEGEDFTFRSQEDFEINIDLFPPLEIEESETSVMVITVDVSGWFKGQDGETLDPKDFNNTERINDNIEHSFEAFEDKYDEELEFEDYVQSVDSDDSSFILENGQVFFITTHTEFDGDFESLEQVAEAMDAGARVEAEGDYFIDSEGKNMVIEVEFEYDDDDDDEDDDDEDDEDDNDDD